MDEGVGDGGGEEVVEEGEVVWGSERVSIDVRRG